MDSLINSAQQLLNPVTLGVIALAVVLVAFIVWTLMRRGRSEHLKRQQALDALDTVAAWPPEITRVLTRSQRIVYSTLYRALPEYMVLAQVPIERFVRVPTRHSYAEWRSRVGLLCADFVVCNAASEVVAVVDLRLPDAQASIRSRERQRRIQRVLKASGVPYHVWREDALPSATTARDVILPAPKPQPEPLSTTIPGGFNPEPEVAPMHISAPRSEGPPSDYPEPDEYIELGGDPTPSTWFDQLSQSDSRHAPLPTSRRSGQVRSSQDGPDTIPGRVPGPAAGSSTESH